MCINVFLKVTTKQYERTTPRERLETSTIEGKISFLCLIVHLVIYNFRTEKNYKNIYACSYSTFVSMVNITFEPDTDLYFTLKS